VGPAWQREKGERRGAALVGLRGDGPRVGRRWSGPAVRLSLFSLFFSFFFQIHFKPNFQTIFKSNILHIFKFKFYHKFLQLF
jgi:hypothetical protein